jgi:membrane protein
MAAAEAAGTTRGEDAGRPWDIPRRGWKDVLLRVKDEIDRDNLSIVAAGVAFYALFAVFPGITALVTLYGLVNDPGDVEQQLAPVRDFVPEEAFGILQQQMQAVVAQATGSLSLGLAFSLALAVWSATKGTKAIFTALNIAYEERETRGFFRLNLTSLAFTVGGILFFITALLVIAAVPAALALLGSTGGPVEVALLVLRWLMMAALMIVALAVLYRYGPSREPARMQWVSPGAIAATVLWLLGSVAFALYVRNFGSYGETFGSLGAVVILLMWFYISAYVVCLGAELNAELERQTHRDSTTGPDRPIGARGAFVADNKV